MVNIVSDQENKTFGIPKALIVINDENKKKQVDNIDIYLEDGGVAYFYHNGIHICLILYQSRICEFSQKPTEYEDIWNKLAKGKAYIKDFKGHHIISTQMIIEALNWLWFPNNGFQIFQIERTTYKNIAKIINNFIFTGEIPKKLIKIF